MGDSVKSLAEGLAQGLPQGTPNPLLSPHLPSQSSHHRRLCPSSLCPSTLSPIFTYYKAVSLWSKDSLVWIDEGKQEGDNNQALSTAVVKVIQLVCGVEIEQPLHQCLMGIQDFVFMIFKFFFTVYLRYAKTSQDTMLVYAKSGPLQNIMVLWVIPVTF